MNEVTTSNTSLLAGRAEVFGDKAGLIIANPNGITCNGCGAREHVALHPDDRCSGL